MFTGIVEELGVVRSIDLRAGSARLAIGCREVIADARLGDSISVNGCCLTVAELSPEQAFAADVMGETLVRTGVGRLVEGDVVNLERAMRADGRFGGHIVQGHVDATATVVDVTEQDAWTLMRFDLPPALAPYIVEKGSITVDGTSLTVAGADAESFWVGLIPHTLAVTVLGRRRRGDLVNLEVDVIAKYVQRMLMPGIHSSGVTPHQNHHPNTDQDG